MVSYVFTKKVVWAHGLGTNCEKLVFRGNIDGFPYVTFYCTVLHGQIWFRIKHGYLLNRKIVDFSVAGRVMVTKIIIKVDGN